MEKIVAQGSKVKVDYDGMLEDGQKFDSSRHGDHSHPLEFTVGERKVIPGFEKAVLGMKIGEEKKVTIAPEEAYGQPDERLTQKIPRDMLPKDKEPEEGMILVMNAPNGQQFPVKISKVEEKEIVIDLNHPLAGKTLIFNLKIVDIE